MVAVAVAAGLGGCQPRRWVSGCPLPCRSLHARLPPGAGLHPAAPGTERTGFMGSRNLGITPPESDQPKIVKNQDICSSNPA